MKRAEKFCVVLVTAPSLKVARQLSRGALRDRLVACVNIIPRIESHYWWRGKVESGAEVLLVCKTIRARLTALERFVVANHPYDTPEFMVMPIAGGNVRYLEWISGSVALKPDR